MARRRAVEETTETQSAADRDQAEHHDREERKAIQEEPRRRVESDEGPRGGARLENGTPMERQSEEDIRRIQNEAIERSRSAKSGAKDDTGILAGAGQEVTVYWGEEIFSPQQFHTFKVGPFSATTRVLVGETFANAAARAMSDLRTFAESERDRKRASYLRMVESTSKRT